MEKDIIDKTKTENIPWWIKYRCCIICYIIGFIIVTLIFIGTICGIVFGTRAREAELNKAYLSCKDDTDIIPKYKSKFCLNNSTCIDDVYIIYTKYKKKTSNSKEKIEIYENSDDDYIGKFVRDKKRYSCFKYEDGEKTFVGQYKNKDALIKTYEAQKCEEGEIYTFKINEDEYELYNENNELILTSYPNFWIDIEKRPDITFVNNKDELVGMIYKHNEDYGKDVWTVINVDKDFPNWLILSFVYIENI